MMNWIEAVVLITSSLLAAMLGVLLQRYFSRARPTVFVKSCELSSTLLSRVDFVDLPQDIAAKFTAFPWTVISKDESVPNNATTLPIGIGQEQLLYLKELLPCVGRTIGGVEGALAEWGKSSVQDRAKRVCGLLHDHTFLRALMGKSVRGTFAILSDSTAIQSLQFDAKNTALTWSLDDASGVGKGILGCFTIHIKDARIRFPFQYKDEMERMQVISFVIASCHETLVPSLLSDVLAQLKDDKVLGSDLEKYFSGTLAKSSTLVLSVAVSNLGTTPVLFLGDASLSIPMPGEQKPASLACRCETYSDKTEEDQAATRKVKILKLISSLLDVPLPIRKRVPTERILVKGGEASTMTFRTLESIKEMKDGDRLLSLYQGAKLRVTLTLPYQEGQKTKLVTSRDFTFGSSLPVAD